MESPASPTVASRPMRRRGKKAGSRPLRWLLFGVPVALVCLLLLILGVRAWLDDFLRSDDFRRFLDRKTSAALQAEARIDPLHWEHSELYTTGIDVRDGSPGGPLTAFNADQVRAAFDLGALWHRVWRIETLDAERITAEFGTNPASKTAPPQPRPDQVAAPGADRGFLASLLPNRMDIGEVRVADFSLRWMDRQSKQMGQLASTRLSARMLGGNYRTWEVEGKGGTLTQGDLPAVTMEDFALKSTEEAVFITRASGRPASGGNLELSGKQTLTGSRDLDLALNLEAVPIEPLLPPDWRGRLHGKATGNVRVAGSPGNAKSWQATGHLNLREGRLEALPVLDQLAVFSASARYRQTVVQKGSADFTWTPDTLTVHNLTLESEGLLRVEGDFTVRDRQVEGLFRVGVAVSTVRWVSQISAALFDLPQHDGYVWTTMHLSGPVDNPHEDLTGRLAASAERAVIEKAKQGTGAVLDTASGLLDLLKPH